jgi:hypothetical protein
LARSVVIILSLDRDRRAAAVMGELQHEPCQIQKISVFQWISGAAPRNRGKVRPLVGKTRQKAHDFALRLIDTA